MKKNLTELVFILDESGSMSDLTLDTIGGFNSLINKQRSEEGEALVSTVLFSNRSKVIHDRVKISDIPRMTEKDYVPNGCTALLDAVGDAIHHIANVHKYAREEDVPEKTLFIITTDGMENASHEYSYEKVKKMIGKEQEKYGWEFIFLGANIDSAATARTLGIKEENAVDYCPDEAGTAAMYESVACAVGNMRSKACIAPDWKSSIERDRAKRTPATVSRPEKKRSLFGSLKNKNK